MVELGDDNLLTVRSNKVVDIINGLIGDLPVADSAGVDPIDGDIGGWDDDSDWS